MSVSVLTVLRNRHFPPQQKKITEYNTQTADRSGRVGLQIACWDCGFELHLGASMSRLWVLCAVRLRFLCKADYSSRGVLPNVMCPMSMIM